MQPGGHRFDPGILHHGRLADAGAWADGPVAGIRKRIVRFFDNRFGKVAKALGET